MLTFIITLVFGLIGIVLGLGYFVACIVFFLELVKSLYAIFKKREYKSNITWYVPIFCMIISCLGMFVVELILFHTFSVSHLITAILWYVVYKILKYYSNKL